MAHTSSRSQSYEATQQQLFTQRNLYQQHQSNRLLAPASQLHSSHTAAAAAPYTKSSSTSVYAAGTTLASNNPAVVRRNARERNRVKQVNNGFLNLRQHIPTAIIADLSNGRRGIGPGAHKKLSKVDTLRMAVEYIRRLQHVIDEVDSSDASSVSSFNSTGSSSGGSPQREVFQNHFMEYPSEAAQQRCYSVSYAGSFPMQQNSIQQANQFSSPVGSYNSTDSYGVSPTLTSRNNNTHHQHHHHHHQLSLKSENSYDEYTSASTDDEELLDYISLWQEDM